MANPTPPMLNEVSELGRLVARALRHTTSDIRLVAERMQDHAAPDRMSPAAFRRALADLGFADAKRFAETMGIAPRTAARWDRFGPSQDVAVLLLALVSYRQRVSQAVTAFDECTHVGLADFFAEHKLP